MSRLPSLAAKIAVAPIETDVVDFAKDYRDVSVSRTSTSAGQPSYSSGLAPVETLRTEPAIFPRGGEPPVPRAKSPGFTVLTELLSSSAGALFTAVVKVLTDDKSSRGILHVCGLAEYKYLVTQALFGQTPPTVLSARAKSTDTSRISPQALLEPLIPQLRVFQDGDDAAYWRETSIVHSLIIACAAAAREEAFYKAVSAGQSLLQIVPVLRFRRRTMPPSGVVAYNVQISRMADLLVSFGRILAHGGDNVPALPAIVEYIECDASTIKHDAYISSPATALTFYTSQSLGTNESIRVLAGSRTDGFSQLAKAVGRRLSKSFKLAVSRPDNEVASLILDSILTIFREGRTRETSICHVIMGLPFRVGDGWIEGTYEYAFQHSVAGGVTRDCFDAILECISDMFFVTSSTSSHLAAGCFEVIYRLTELPPDHTSDAARRIRYAANRLRSVHFWTTYLKRFLANHSNGAACLLHQLSSIAPDSRPKGIDKCLQCLAWLLKSVSSELLALDFTHAGNASGHHRLLLSLLFSSPYQLFMSLLTSMPIINDGDAYIGHQDTPSREVLEVSRVPMSGAPEVVAGYNCVDQMKLERISSNSVVEEQSKWAGKWNEWVAWDCASSHLSGAALYLVESATLSSDPAGRFGIGPSVTAIFDLSMPFEILQVILLRLVGEETSETRGAMMDDEIISRVSASLSRIVLVVAEQVASTNGGSNTLDISAEGRAVQICHLLIHVVILSASVDQGRPLLPHEKLRTATFGLALSVILKSNPAANLLDGLTDEFLTSAIALGRLVCSGRVYGAVEPIDGQRARHLALVAFCSVLGLYRVEGNQTFMSLMTASCDAGQERTIIESVVSLVADIDVQISQVVEKIVACKDGPALLVDSGLPQALQQAAEEYVSQEKKVLEDIRYQNYQFDVPVFLQGHAEVMKALLLSPIPSRNRVASDMLGVLLTYTDVIDRLVGSFPQNGHVLIDVLHCLLLTTEESSTLKELTSDKRSSIWNGDILRLSYNLSQNPLPRSNLPPLPLKLNDGNRASVSRNVSISDANTSESWWDTLDQSALSDSLQENLVLAAPLSGRSDNGGWNGITSPLEGSNGDTWSTSTYTTALTGAEALDASLSYLELLSIESPLVDGYALARGLCRCSDVAKVRVTIVCRCELLEIASDMHSVVALTKGSPFPSRVSRAPPCQLFWQRIFRLNRYCSV